MGAFQPILPFQRELLFLYLHCTVVLTVAVLLARLGSIESAMVAPLSVITVPAGAVTFIVNRTVHVVFGAMLLFSWQTNLSCSLIADRRPALRLNGLGFGEVRVDR
jgi:hypothetical protein